MGKSKSGDAQTEALAPLSLEQLTREAVELHELLTDLEMAEEPQYDEYRHEMLPPDSAAITVCRASLGQYMTALAKKVDSVSGYLRFCEMQASYARKAESAAWRWAKRWEAREENLKKYVAGVITNMNLAKPRLEGVTSRLRVQGNGQAGVVFDQSFDIAALPAEYLDVTIRMSAPLYAAFQQFTADLGVEDAHSQMGRAEVSLSRLGADLAQGVEVAGAKLVKGVHLRVE